MGNVKILSMITATLLMSGSFQAGAQDYSWSYYGELPATHDYMKMAQKTLDRIKERTDGRLKITFSYYGETPYKVGDALSLVRDGLVDVTGWLPSYSAGTFPMLAGPELPFILADLPDAAEGQALTDKAWQTPLILSSVETILSGNNAVEVGSYYFEPMNLWFNSAIDGRPDMSGKKIRVFSPELAATISSLGGEPVNIDTTEVYTSLQRRVIDGVVTGIGTLTGQKLSEVLKSGYKTNIMYTSSKILVNSNKFAELPDDLRDVLTEEFAKLSDDLRAYMVQSVEDKEKVLTASGIVITPAEKSDYAAMRDVAEKSVWPEWVKRAGGDSAEALKQIDAAVAAGE